MSSAPAVSAQAPTSRTRLAALDGLRGIAIVLVVLNHSFLLFDRPKELVGRLLVSSGDFAVTFFLVIGGFLATRALLREVDQRGQARPAMFFVRRWIRVSGQVYPFLVVVLIVTALSTTAYYQDMDTSGSVWAILTYTWAGFVQDNWLTARSDFGHLWYVCTDIWGVGVIALVVFLLRGRRLPLAVVFVALALLVDVYRRHMFGEQGQMATLMEIQARADGLFWGAFAATVLPWARSLRSFGREIGLAMVVALFPLAWAVNDERFFTMWTVVLGVALALLIITVALDEPPLFASHVLQARPLVLLGEYSFVIYLYHYPTFWYLHVTYGDSWETWQLATVGFAASALLAVIAQRVVERPLVRWLASDWWSVFRAGLLPGLRDLVLRRRGPETNEPLSTSDPAGPLMELDAEDSTAQVDRPGS